MPGIYFSKNSTQPVGLLDVELAVCGQFYVFSDFHQTTSFSQLQPLVAPQVSHFMQVPLRTMVKLAHSEQLSPV